MCVFTATKLASIHERQTFLNKFFFREGRGGHRKVQGVCLAGKIEVEHQLNFEVFVPFKILDRNSQVYFRKPMIKAMDREESPAHGVLHALWPNTC
jgi:hypothetical protein